MLTHSLPRADAATERYRDTVQYEERPAPSGLEGTVSRMWFLEAPRVRRFEKILPLPFVHVIVNLSEPYAIHDRRGIATGVSDAFVSGLQSEYLVIESPPLIRHVGVELTPAGLHTMAPDASATSAAKVQDARAILPGIDAFVERVRAAPRPDGALDAAAEYVKAARVRENDPLVSTVLSAMHADPDVAVGRIADRLGVSHRTLIARFRAVTGTTPKQHAQVLRFHRFVDALPAPTDSPDWAGLAAASGYYDQPHVIRSFRRFSGWTPTEYRRLVADHGPDAAHFVPLDQAPGATQARS